MSRFPSFARATFRTEDRSPSLYSDESGTLDQSDISSIWWRRPSHCDVVDDSNAFDREFCQAECDHFLQGWLWKKSCLWVNDPQKNRLASRKVVQLDRAIAAGLNVPRTLITNDPEQVRDFVDDVKTRVVFKRTGASPGPLSKTSFFTSDIGKRLDAIRSAPTTFQEYIEPGADIRSIWVDGEIFSARIESASSATPEDARFDHSVRYVSTDLPAEVSDGLRVLLTELGLGYAAVDFRIDTEGLYHFLEINPAGQYLYVELKTGLPITAALASLLARGA